MIKMPWSWLVLLSVVPPLIAAARPARGGDDSASAILEAANRLLAALSPEQKGKALLAFSPEVREDWHFIPKAERKGLPLKEMLPEQMHLTHGLLNASLSRVGYGKTVTVMSLESVLRELEMRAGGRSPMLGLRDPLRYYVSIFGEPSAEGGWGWSLEGHHVSLNFTMAGGQVATSPAFLGANPHVVPDGPRSGLRALAGEEDRGRALLLLLDAGQRARAILDVKAPTDIFSAASRAVEFEAPAKGLPAAAMNAEQQQALRSLIETYVENVPADLQAKRRAQYEGADFAEIHFAWMGSTDKGIGNGHYYRVQAPTFLIEYDNVQNNANHSHTVWRDYDGDFGRDLLAEHHAAVKH